MTQPLVSIILCTYNRRKLLSRAVKSVLSQTHRDWELIVIDDGSRDGSGDLLRSYTRIEPRICYRWQPNKGLAMARNAGLRIARGTYVTFLDSDDEYSPRHLSLRLTYLQKHPDVHGVFGGMRIIGPRKAHYVPDVDHPGRKIHASRCHSAGTLIVERTCIQQIGGFRKMPFSEDYDLIKRLQNSYRLVRVGFRTYHYHVGSQDRLCSLFEKGGEEAIERFREGNGKLRGS